MKRTLFVIVTILSFPLCSSSAEVAVNPVVCNVVSSCTAIPDTTFEKDTISLCRPNAPASPVKAEKIDFEVFRNSKSVDYCA